LLEWIGLQAKVSAFECLTIRSHVKVNFIYVIWVLTQIIDYDLDGSLKISAVFGCSKKGIGGEWRQTRYCSFLSESSTLMKFKPQRKLKFSRHFSWNQLGNSSCHVSLGSHPRFPSYLRQFQGNNRNHYLRQFITVAGTKMRKGFTHYAMWKSVKAAL
jgi:hypothetical protein